MHISKIYFEYSQSMKRQGSSANMIHQRLGEPQPEAIVGSVSDKCQRLCQVSLLLSLSANIKLTCLVPKTGQIGQNNKL